MTDRDFESLLALGHESNGVEFKGSGSWTDRSFQAKVIRAILGMANRRDGGLVIIGVESANLEPVGLDDETLATWLDYDDPSVAVNEHASPSVSFDLEPFDYQSKKLVIIRVHEFGEIPILCTKDFEDHGKPSHTLRRGACYVRARHKPETSEIPSEEEMRELLELAIDKGVKRFVERAQRAGMFTSIGPTPPPPNDAELFRTRIEGLE